MRLRRSTADNPAHPDLPAGYDDPASEFYVPEELRDVYRVHPDADAQRITDGGPLRLAQQRAALEHYDHLAAREDAAVAAGSMSPTARQYPRAGLPTGRQAARAAAYPRFEAPTTPTAHDVALHLHRHRIADAARARQQLDQATRQRAEYEQAHTCAVCGRLDAQVQARPYGLRALASRAGSPAAATAHLCPSCAAYLEHVIAERAGAEQIGDHTRAELAARFLEDGAPGRDTRTIGEIYGITAP